MQVLDASALAEMLLQTDAGREVLDVLESDLHAPELIVPECLSVLRGWGLAGHAPWPRLEQAVEDLLSMPILLWPMAPLAHHAWRLRHNLSSYDAMYAALADTLDAELVTCDQRLARGAPARVVVRHVSGSDG